MLHITRKTIWINHDICFTKGFYIKSRILKFIAHTKLSLSGYYYYSCTTNILTLPLGSRQTGASYLVSVYFLGHLDTSRHSLTSDLLLTDKSATMDKIVNR